MLNPDPLNGSHSKNESRYPLHFTFCVFFTFPMQKVFGLENRSEIEYKSDFKTFRMVGQCNKKARGKQKCSPFRNHAVYKKSLFWAVRPFHFILAFPLLSYSSNISHFGERLDYGLHFRESESQRRNRKMRESRGHNVSHFALLLI